MEHARIFLAILLSFLVFFVWEFFFIDRDVTRQKPQTAVVEKRENGKTISQKDEPLPATASARAEETVDNAENAISGTEQNKLTVQSSGVKQARTFKIENRYFRIEIDEKGGSVKRVELKDYRQEVGKDAKPYLLLDRDVQPGSGWIGLKEGNADLIESAIFRADTDKQKLDVFENPLNLTMRYARPDGLRVEKIFKFKPDSYIIDMDVVVTNGTSQQLTANLYAGISQLQPKKKDRYGFSGPSALIDEKLKEVDVGDIEKQDQYSGKIRWIAVQNRYFLSALATALNTDSIMKLSHNEANVLNSELIAPEQSLLPGQTFASQYQLYFGPKRMDVLKQYGIELERVIHFGMFDFIAKPCLWFMNWVYGFIPNYGIAIILLTLLTKILLWPLGNKSYKSMNEMRRMQPLMTEIREKHKNDKKKMNEEMMNLYRVYKVNPLGGCLPMLVQLPVFFALYRMLYEAIELRHAPFFGWINDLSAPDRLFSFNITIPLMEPPYGIPVLTLIMGATMFLQQKMTPTPGDPTQAKMMTFMPIIFTVIFVNFSSGLVLYWLINNVVSISQQYYIYKKS